MRQRVRKTKKWTDEWVFQRVVEIAIERGWNMFTFKDWPYHVGEIIELDNLGIKVSCAPRPFLFSINDVLFNHGWAKAFWGTDLWCFGWNKKDIFDVMHWGWFPPGVPFPSKEHAELITGKEAWKYNLQQIALEKKPIKYLYSFVKEYEESK